MSNRNTYLLVGLFGVALIAYFSTQYVQRRVQYDWNESWGDRAYSESSNQPYGTLIFYRLLQAYFPGRSLKNITEKVSGELPLKSDRRLNYVFVGSGLYLDSLSTQRLLDFVDAGNTALLSSKTIPFDLMFHLYFRECAGIGWNDYEYFEATDIRASLPGKTPSKAASLHFAHQNQPRSYRWSYIESEFFCDSLPPRPLGYLNDSLVNFAVFPYGKGRFFLHTTPLALTNYQLLRPEGRAYVESLLAYLPEGDIFWDTCSRVPEAVARLRNTDHGGAYSREMDSEHPFSYILKQPPLAWAWYLIAALTLLYVLFNARRRQRIIPILPKNENSSYEFIRTIANLHFREKNYQNLCIQQMRLFLAQLRERYGLVIQIDAASQKPRTDTALLERLAQVSEVPMPQIQDIFTQYTATVQYEPTEDMMVGLNLAMEAFFKKAK